MRIINIVDDNVIFESENQNDFIDFVNKIRIENEDNEFSIIELSDAIEYVKEYCSNLLIN